MRRFTLILLAALLVPACGDSDSDSGGGGGGGPPPGTPPGSPTGVAAIPGNGHVTLEWIAVAGAQGYLVNRSTVSGGPYGIIGDARTEPRAVDSSVINGITYFYVITAVNESGESPPSPEVSATPTAGQPPLPTTWRKHPGNPLLSGNNEQLNAPVVLKIGGTWVMYHNIYNNQTGHYGIGRATSTDGVSWTRTGTVLTASNPFHRVELGSVLFDGTTWRMWYESGGIHLATSSDGLTWTTSGVPVLTSGAPGSFDDSFITDPCVIHDGTEFKMWYEGGKSGPRGAMINPKAFGYATSPDGITWSKYPGPVFGPTDPDSASFEIRTPFVMRIGDVLWMVYTRSAGSMRNQSAFVSATSPDGINWTPAYSPDTPPILQAGPPGSWDERMSQPWVVRDGDRYWMWYSTGAIGLATSP